ncbi:dephospho-CoA kinase [Acidicapsa ligni]|uniref:dephospho-CoA kinase n=1 Tax=Acidicapsa ligni TaxID=542300 RepID=UPI0021E0E848|nr:dephospho-CoA kinase [Acidicapsa ligni]
MLRVGLTGGLGSGKSTVAQYFRELGANVIEADELGRALMEPGQPVFAEIVHVFGEDILAANGHLDRARLAGLAFTGGRLHELNAIVHPAVIAAQVQWMKQVFAQNQAAVAMVESALIFEVERDARQRGESESLLTDWRQRFDCVILVTAPDDVKIARFVSRVSPGGWNEQTAADARSRLSRQLPDADKIPRADYVIENAGDRSNLQDQVTHIWSDLVHRTNKSDRSPVTNITNIS